MDTETIKSTTLENGNTIRYKIVNGTAYHLGMTLKGQPYKQDETPDAVVRILEDARRTGQRLRLHYGSSETGRDWLEEHDVTGRISRSIGPIRIPLMIKSPQSNGGPGLLDNCIVKITTTTKPKQVLYKHPKYHTPKLTLRNIKPGEKVGDVDLYAQGFRQAVYADDSNVANFKLIRQALRYMEQFKD